MSLTEKLFGHIACWLLKIRMSPHNYFMIMISLKFQYRSYWTAENIGIPETVVLEVTYYNLEKAYLGQGMGGSIKGSSVNGGAVLKSSTVMILQDFDHLAIAQAC